MAPRLVIFDFHNTLFHADRWFELETRCLASSVACVLSELGYVKRPTAAEMAALDEMYRRRRLEVHSSGIEMELVPELLALFGHGGFAVESWMVLRTLDALEYGCLPYAFPFPGVHRCLSRLSEAGTRMAVLSSALYAPFLTWALERFGLLRYFEKILTSVEAGYYKSDPRLFRSLLDDLGVDAADAVHVGDSYRFDVEGAKRAGIKVVWFNAGGGPSLADASVDNLVGLPDVIAAL